MIHFFSFRLIFSAGRDRESTLEVIFASVLVPQSYRGSLTIYQFAERSLRAVRRRTKLACKATQMVTESSAMVTTSRIISLK